MENSWELRGLLRTVGKLSNYRKLHVYFGDSVFGEFTEAGNDNHLEFEVRYDLITEETKGMNMEIKERSAMSLYETTAFRR